MAYDLSKATGTVEHEVDPISRIEGHLGVKVKMNAAGTLIEDANAHGNLWRGFENFLLGRAANDAITFTQRICGVCPVPHGMTATYAADTVLGYSAGHITFKTAGATGVPAKAVLIRNLVLSAEFLMSSITHFYHLAAPSYVQGPAMPPWTPYFANSYYHAALLSTAAGTGAVRPGGAGTPAVLPDAAAGTTQLWDAVIISYVRALKIRRLTFEAGALFAGRMPMTSCYVAGGVTNDGTEDLTDRCNQFESIIQAVGLFIVNEYVPIALALGALYLPFDNTANGGAGYGAGLGNFLSWGAFPNLDDTLTLPGGYKGAVATNFTVANKAQVASQFLAGANSVPLNLTEDISHSRYDATAGYTNANTAYPGAIDRTKPNRAKATAYTYMKAPRWAGQACEVGPLARLAVAGIYPVDGVTALNTIPGYKEIYLTDGATPSTGIDSRVLAPTIANALLNMGLATLIGAGPGVTGTVPTWIIGIIGGLSTMDRLRARALESLVLVQKMVGTVSKNTTTGALSFAENGWIHQLKCLTNATYAAANTFNTAVGGWGLSANNTVGSTWTDKSIPVGTVQGWGGTEAPRGALMHQSKITNGKIVAYQCIVPTTWNGSPKDAGGKNGAIEQAVIGAPFNPATTAAVGGGGGAITVSGGVEVLRIAQSFDPCIACAVH